MTASGQGATLGTVRLTIGDFATLSHLSVRTLRKYHDAGLLRPDHVDPVTGYRYYSPAQLPDAQIIRRFRALDMPVREIATIVGTTDVDARSALVTEHLHRLERRLAATHDAVEALQRLLAPSPAPVAVTHRREPARTVVATSADVEVEEVLDWYGSAMRRVDAAVAAAGARVTGPPGGCYDNSLFTEGAGHAVVWVPTDRPVAAGDVDPVELAGRGARRHRPRGPAPRHRRHLRRTGAAPRGARHDRRRAGAGEVPVRPARHGRPGGVAHRDRLAGLPRGRGVIGQAVRDRHSSHTKYGVPTSAATNPAGS